MSTTEENLLGAFLKDRRAKLNPTTFGFTATRRRTPGLRREEVAQRANVSATWYTWLEQGRGGSPSSEVLERLARALALTSVEREHLFVLAQHRPPQLRYEVTETVTPQLQRVLDALTFSPAIVKNATWDIVAWNRAATAVLTDYAAIPPEQRNVLRLMFQRRSLRAAQADWEGVARFVVAVFRADTARLGVTERVKSLVEELCQTSREFEAMWRDNDVRAYGEGKKFLHHKTLGRIALEFSAFAVDRRPDLGMVVYNPATPDDAERIATLIQSQAAQR
ncbi:helix-turn-helix transcriptional regulator [Dyella caseinilytica]|uniref:Helix-turn-helix domain-containing protein n=1 Tax=Dyella caseinilytica TaxID=1849581 RepID=A0ABX7GW38_9GAMM|nr:helix-turn-helix transcriptional regulator [Dyella caseinilytica]QRN53420.1 helix-turn-helix domain-containing protein [Dyella caseinilytica]GFZ86401.1 transcriptional regulator [Dyella caseinilytica]